MNRILSVVTLFVELAGDHDFSEVFTVRDERGDLVAISNRWQLLRLAWKETKGQS